MKLLILLLSAVAAYGQNLNQLQLMAANLTSVMISNLQQEQIGAATGLLDTAQMTLSAITTSMQAFATLLNVTFASSGVNMSQVAGYFQGASGPTYFDQPTLMAHVNNFQVLQNLTALMSGALSNASLTTGPLPDPTQFIANTNNYLPAGFASQKVNGQSVQSFAGSLTQLQATICSAINASAQLMSAFSTAVNFSAAASSSGIPMQAYTNMYSQGVPTISTQYGQMFQQVQQQIFCGTNTSTINGNNMTGNVFSQQMQMMGAVKNATVAMQAAAQAYLNAPQPHNASMALAPLMQVLNVGNPTAAMNNFQAVATMSALGSDPTASGMWSNIVAAASANSSLPPSLTGFFTQTGQIVAGIQASGVSSQTLPPIFGGGSNGGGLNIPGFMGFYTSTTTKKPVKSTASKMPPACVGSLFLTVLLSAFVGN